MKPLLVRLPYLLLTAILLAVVGILASCEVLDSVTGGVTQPRDPVPATQQAPTAKPLPAPLVELARMVADAEVQAVKIREDIAQAEAQAQAGGDPKVIAVVAKLKAENESITNFLVVARPVLERSLAALGNPDGKPAGEVITGTLGPPAAALPFPLNVYGGLAVAGLSLLGSMIQGYRERRKRAEAEADAKRKEEEAKANMATAENLVTSLEAMKVAGLSMTTDEGRAVLSTVQTPETQALVRSVTKKITE